MQRSYPISQKYNNSYTRLINSKFDSSPWLVSKETIGNKSNYENIQPLSSLEVSKNQQSKKMTKSKRLKSKSRVVIFSKLQVGINEGKNNQEFQENILHSKSNISQKKDNCVLLNQNKDIQNSVKNRSESITIQKQREELSQQLERKRTKILQRLTQNMKIKSQNINNNKIFNNSDIVSILCKKQIKRQQISQQDYQKIKKVINYQQNKKLKINHFISLPSSPIKTKQINKKNSISIKDYYDQENKFFNNKRNPLTSKIRTISHQLKEKQGKDIQKGRTNNTTLHLHKYDNQQLPPIDNIYNYFSNKYIPITEVVKKNCQSVNQIWNDGLPIQTRSVSHKLLENLKKFCLTQSKQVRKCGKRKWRTGIPPMNLSNIWNGNKVNEETLIYTPSATPTTIKQNRQIKI